MLSKRQAFFVSLLLAAFCYLNALPNKFIFDDQPIVASNPAIRTIAPLKFLQSPYWDQKQYEGIYRPFTIFSLSVDYAMWKQWAPGFRLTNLALHAMNGFLIHTVCTSIAGAGIVPVAAMIIHVVHPVHSEAVTTIIGRSDLFAACFFLLAWILFRRGHTLWPALLFLLALLSKENAIVLPGILILDALFSPQAYARRSGELPPLARFAMVCATAAAYLALRFSVLGGLGIPAAAQYMAGHLTYVQRLMTSGRVFIEYLRLVFFPLNLAGDYDFNAIPIANVRNWDAWFGLILIVSIAAAAFLLRRRSPAAGFGVLFAFAAFIPSSNWIFPISVLMAERFLYLPLVGLSIAAAVLFNSLNEPRARRIIAVGAVLAAIVVCNGHDYTRRNDFTFFHNMVRVEPASAKARLGYGYALLQAGRNEEAARQFEAGLQIIPDYPELLTTLAMTRMTSADCAQAWPLLKRALGIDPSHADAHRRMGDCYFKEGRIEEAESMYSFAVQNIAYPDPALYVVWARTLEQTGRAKSAIGAYERAALLSPNDASIRQRLSVLRTTSDEKE